MASNLKCNWDGEDRGKMGEEGGGWWRMIGPINSRTGNKLWNVICMRPRFACWTSTARLDAAKPVLNWIPSNSGPRSGLWDGSAFDHPRSSSKLARHLVENEGGRAPVPKLNGMGTNCLELANFTEIGPVPVFERYNAPASCQTPSEKRLRETHCGGTNSLLRSSLGGEIPG